MYICICAGSISPDSKKLLMVSDQGTAYLYCMDKTGLYEEFTRYKGKTIINFTSLINNGKLKLCVSR